MSWILVFMGGVSVGGCLPAVWILLFGRKVRAFEEPDVLEAIYRHTGCGIQTLKEIQADLRGDP